MSSLEIDDNLDPKLKKDLEKIARKCGISPEKIREGIKQPGKRYPEFPSDFVDGSAYLIDIAASFGTLALMKLLVENHHLDQSDSRPLHHACYADQAEMVNYLLTFPQITSNLLNCNKTPSDEPIMRPLAIATYRQNSPAVVSLVRHGAAIEIPYRVFVTDVYLDACIFSIHTSPEILLYFKAHGYHENEFGTLVPICQTHQEHKSGGLFPEHEPSSVNLPPLKTPYITALESQPGVVLDQAITAQLRRLRNRSKEYKGFMFINTLLNWLGFKTGYARKEKLNALTLLDTLLRQNPGEIVSMLSQNEIDILTTGKTGKALFFPTSHHSQTASLFVKSTPGLFSRRKKEKNITHIKKSDARIRRGALYIG